MKQNKKSQNLEVPQNFERKKMIDSFGELQGEKRVSNCTLATKL